MLKLEYMVKLAVQNKKNLENVARRQVVGLLREIFSDPDSGLLLRENIGKRLSKSIKSKKDGKYKNLGAVLEKYSSR